MLYGKVSEVIKLKPFTFLETIEYLYNTNPNWNTNEFLNYYFFTGGVARYLDRIKSNEDINTNYFNIFFNGSDFNNEFDNLFLTSFDSKKDLHRKIIKLFEKKEKLTIQQILHFLKNEGNKSSIYNTLKELTISNILTYQTEENKENSGYYYLTDLFCYSFLKVYQEKPSLNQENQRNKIMKGYAFEILTLLNTDLIIEEIKRSGFNYEKFFWNNHHAEIDLLIKYHQDKYSIIECKNYSDTFKINKEYIKKIIKKKEEFLNSFKLKKDQNKEIDFIIFTIWGASSTDNNFKFFNISLDKIIKNYLKFII